VQLPNASVAVRSIAVDRATGKLLKQVRACDLCAGFLPEGPRPVLQVHPGARILIAGQAPGSRVHKTGVPFDDASGDRLRDWMGIDKTIFYDPALIAILPMGFCYPGTGKSGDLPPRPECAAAWRARLLARMPSIQLTLVIGKYALDWHLNDTAGANLTETVRAWRDHGPDVLPLPHPSPRNNVWLKRNGWFEDEVLPFLRKRVRKVLRGVGAWSGSK
jgi:uracil-DNA glycosylase